MAQVKDWEGLLKFIFNTQISVVPGNAPNVASSASASTPPVVSAPVINASLPTVSIQLRLGDGTR